jgi:hypothetical protein
LNGLPASVLWLRAAKLSGNSKETKLHPCRQTKKVVFVEMGENHPVRSMNTTCKEYWLCSVVASLANPHSTHRRAENRGNRWSDPFKLALA